MQNVNAKCICYRKLIYLYVNNLTIHSFLQKPLQYLLYHLFNIYNATVDDVCNYCKYSLNYGFCTVTGVFKINKVLC